MGQRRLSGAPRALVNIDQPPSARAASGWPTTRQQRWNASLRELLRHGNEIHRESLFQS